MGPLISSEVKLYLINKNKNVHRFAVKGKRLKRERERERDGEQEGEVTARQVMIEKSCFVENY